jgi:hypothetical protein
MDLGWFAPLLVPVLTDLVKFISDYHFEYGKSSQRIKIDLRELTIITGDAINYAKIGVRLQLDGVLQNALSGFTLAADNHALITPGPMKRCFSPTDRTREQSNEVFGRTRMGHSTIYRNI